MKIKVTKTETIDSCCHQCPYFGVDDGPGGAMVCEHPDINKKYKETGDMSVLYIISHPECDNGFPKKCPLFSHINKTGH